MLYEPAAVEFRFALRESRPLDSYVVGKRIIHRVVCRLRSGNNLVECAATAQYKCRPLHEDDTFDVLNALVHKNGQILGMYVFPRKVFIDHKIVTHGQNIGARHIMLHLPPWEQPPRLDKSTGIWTHTFFIDLRSKHPPKQNDTGIQKLICVLESY